MLGTQWLLSTKRLVLCVWFCGQWLEGAREAGVGGSRSVFDQPLVTQCVVSSKEENKNSKIPSGYLLSGPTLSLQFFQFSLACINDSAFFLINSFSPFPPFFLCRLQLVRCWNSWIDPSMFLYLSLFLSPGCVVHVCMCMPEISLTLVSRPYVEIFNFGT